MAESGNVMVLYRYRPGYTDDEPTLMAAAFAAIISDGPIFLLTLGMKRVGTTGDSLLHLWRT